MFSKNQNWLTVTPKKQDRREALDAGMDEHITKPIKVDSVIKIISKFID